MDDKADTSAITRRLDTLKLELEHHEERVRAIKQLIEEDEALIIHSQQEAETLTVQIKTELVELTTLSKQILVGEDKDDEAVIARADRVRVDAVQAIDAFLQ